MSELIDAIIKTRKITAGIFAESLVSIGGLSEVQIAEKILSEVKNHDEIYSEGWYNPPASGVCVLLDKNPFERLKYDSLRKPEYYPKENIYFDKESVGMIFFSPVHRKKNLIGDIGFTMYKGGNLEIREHVKKSYSAILEITKHAKVGMTFSELSIFAENFLKNQFKIVMWVTKHSNPTTMNFGHTVPGSYENINFGNSFEEIKGIITKGRVYVKEIENFEIPKTCAFTIETRLLDLANPNLPCVYFHFIVCFDEGKKTILENFDKLFTAVGMNYMNE